MDNVRDKDVDQFLSKYEASAELSKRRRYKTYRLQSYRDWTGTVEDINFPLETESMVKLYIPQYYFRRLVERDHMVQDLIRGQEGFNHLLEQRKEDERIRQENPGVQTAYEKYQILLEIARK